MNDQHRTHALEMADDATRTDHFDSEAIVHALIYVGDAIERQTTVCLVNAEVFTLITKELEKLNGKGGAPKLTALLSRPTPSQSEKADDEPGPDAEDSEEEDAAEETNGYYLPNGRPYRPATNPEDWRLDANTGEYVSPAGRRYNPRAHHVQGMLKKLKRRGIMSVKLYDPEEPRPIKTD